MTEEYLTTLYQDIKHKNKELTKNQIEELVRNTEQEYVTGSELLPNSILCLSLGSSFIEDNPGFLKQFFQMDFYDDDLEELFRAIQFSNVMDFYLGEILSYSSLNKYMGNFELACIGAINALGGYIYKSKNSEVYRFLYQRFRQTLGVLDSTSDKDDRDEIKVYLKFCYKALLYSLHGKDSERMPFEIDEVLSEGISIQKEL